MDRKREEKKIDTQITEFNGNKKCSTENEVRKKEKQRKEIVKSRRAGLNDEFHSKKKPE